MKNAVRRRVNYNEIAFMRRAVRRSEFKPTTAQRFWRISPGNLAIGFLLIIAALLWLGAYWVGK